MAKKDGPKARPRSERFEVEHTMSTGELAGYLEGLAKGFREGTVVLGDEAGGFRAAIAGDVELDVQARSGKRKSRIELTLAFRADQDEVAPSGRSADGDGDSAVAYEPPQATIPDEMSF
jgi:amphi-Trp domain-containing protein